MGQVDNQVLQLRQPDLFWREIDGDIVALDGRSWEYLTVNEAGRMLWERLVAGATRTELIDRLIDSYGIEDETAQVDVDSFLAELQAKGLLSQ